MSAREVIAVVLIGMPHSNPVTQADAILAALSATGFAVLPVKATKAMTDAVPKHHPYYHWGQVWNVMLAAAQEDSTDA